MNSRARVLAVLLGAATMGAAISLLSLRHTVTDVRPAPAAQPAVPAAASAPRLLTESVSIQAGHTLDALLGRAGVDARSRMEIISAAKEVFDLRRLRAGSQLVLTRGDAGALEALQYIIDPDHELRLSRAAGVFEAAVVEIPGAIRVVPVCGTMRHSLFDSIERAGEPAELALQVAEIFAWDLDFYTDPQQGDEFCFLVEKKEYTNGQPPICRRILAARYNNAGTVYEGYLFPDSDGKPRYYSADGRSLQAAFLRSPMKFEARVSSRFSRRRFHPVLKRYRPHLGTDYAAPAGAPVQAVASGRVTFSGRSGGAGNLVRIRHANGYESMYLHLSRRFVRAGQRVAQGQRIGSVGATGLATGPHLDFRLRRNGRYVDFERFKPPRATRLAADRMDVFAAQRGDFAALMDGRLRSTATVADAGPPPEATGGN